MVKYLRKVYTFDCNRECEDEDTCLFCKECKYKTNVLHVMDFHLDAFKEKGWDPEDFVPVDDNYYVEDVKEEATEW